jgi:hypothetical protein
MKIRFPIIEHLPSPNYVFLDIFPMDNVPKKLLLRRVQPIILHILTLKLLVFSAACYTLPTVDFGTKMLKRIVSNPTVQYG